MTIEGVQELNPHHGVVTLFGYGITVRVDRGHLILHDGIGSARREARLPRVGHGLKRLVIIGADGMVSLSALRWLADQDAAFVMLDRDGSVLVATGPVRPSDARLRRAQSLALQSEAGLRLAQGLILGKLDAQRGVVLERFRDEVAANAIEEARDALAAAKSLVAIRQLESQAALAYWSCWRKLPIPFPKSDLRRLPEHWRAFGGRSSPLTGSPRLAANPPNAILNYLYALLESEARLAAAALGLDPGLGVLHMDSPSRDSLACDLMEPVRPQVDSLLLDWLAASPLKREWFFEQRDGNCRIMSSFAVRLSETIPTWRRAVAPVAEWFAQVLSRDTRLRPRKGEAPPTRLTQSHKRQAHGGPPSLPSIPTPRPQGVCFSCGAAIPTGRNYCAACAVTFTTEQLNDAARRGRVVAQGALAQAKRAETQRRHVASQKSHDSTPQHDRMDEETYRTEVLPLLSQVSRSAIASALGVSQAYATDVRRGKRMPHPRHWAALKRLVDFTRTSEEQPAAIAPSANP